jgi:GTPase
VILSATKFVSERLCPIFQVSNVNGENLDLLKMFLNLLGSRTPNTDEDPSEFQIDDTYLVPGVGTVVSLTILVWSITYQEDLMKSQFLRPANYSLWKDHVISTGHQMTNLVLNVCFDFFSRHENQI